MNKWIVSIVLLMFAGILVQSWYSLLGVILAYIAGRIMSGERKYNDKSLLIKKMDKLIDEKLEAFYFKKEIFIQGLAENTITNWWETNRPLDSICEELKEIKKKLG